MSYRGGKDADIPPVPGPEHKPRLLGEVRARLRAKRYSLRTEQAYLYWIKQFVKADYGTRGILVAWKSKVFFGAWRCAITSPPALRTRHWLRSCFFTGKSFSWNFRGWRA